MSTTSNKKEELIAKILDIRMYMQELWFAGLMRGKIINWHSELWDLFSEFGFEFKHQVIIDLEKLYKVVPPIKPFEIKTLLHYQKIEEHNDNVFYYISNVEDAESEKLWTRNYTVKKAFCKIIRKYLKKIQKQLQQELAELIKNEG